MNRWPNLLPDSCCWHCPHHWHLVLHIWFVSGLNIDTLHAKHLKLAQHVPFVFIHALLSNQHSLIAPFDFERNTMLFLPTSTAKPLTPPWRSGSKAWQSLVHTIFKRLRFLINSTINLNSYLSNRQYQTKKQFKQMLNEPVKHGVSQEWCKNIASPKQ